MDWTGTAWSGLACVIGYLDVPTSGHCAALLKLVMSTRTKGTDWERQYELWLGRVWGLS